MYKTTRFIFLNIAVIFLSSCSASPMPQIRESAAALSETPPTHSQLLPAPASLKESTDSGERFPQLIYVRDRTMAATGRKAYLTCGTADGTITVQVPSDTAPQVNGEANFACVGAPFISLCDGAAAVLTEDYYQLFLADDMVEYHGIYKKKSDLSQDTLKWLDFYYSLDEAERNAISMVPGEFSDSLMSSSAAAIETQADSSDPYGGILSAEEILETEELAQKYFTVDVPTFEGVDQIYPVDFDDPLYQNVGLEGEYAPGNIIIYKVLTVKDRRDGNPFRFISLARNTKSDSWKIINSGY